MYLMDTTIGSRGDSGWVHTRVQGVRIFGSKTPSLKDFTFGTQDWIQAWIWLFKLGEAVFEKYYLELGPPEHNFMISYPGLGPRCKLLGSKDLCMGIFAITSGLFLVQTVMDFFGSNGSGSTFNCMSLDRPPVYSRTPSAYVRNFSFS